MLEQTGTHSAIEVDTNAGKAQCLRSGSYGTVVYCTVKLHGKCALTTNEKQ